MTADEVHAQVAAMCQARSQKDVAAELGISTTYLNDYLHFKRAPGAGILEGLGLRAVISYERVKE